MTLSHMTINRKMGWFPYLHNDIFFGSGIYSLFRGRRRDAETEGDSSSAVLSDVEIRQRSSSQVLQGKSTCVALAHQPHHRQWTSRTFTCILS